MKMMHQYSWLLVAGALIASAANGAGYEKNIPFSGRYAGIAGASVSSVQGPESVFFNPAGLAGSEGWQANIDFSPTFAKFSGPVIKNGDVKQGERLMIPIFGVSVSKSLNEKWTLGAAFGSVGGSQAKYTDVNATDVDATNYAALGAQTVKTDLKIYELGLAAGYKLNPNWSFGASWRATFVQAGFSTYSPHPLVASNVAQHLSIYDLSDKQWLGFRFGVQYRADSNNWGLGAALRTHQTFATEGKASGRLGTSTIAADIGEVDAGVKSAFPLQLLIGGDFRVSEKWKMFTEYVWTQYSKNKEVELSGTLNVPTFGAVPLASKNIKQDWFDQHHIKLAAEYAGFADWPLRFGYIFTTQVVPKGNALASFPSPGVGHNFTLGTSHNIGNVALSAAFEYGVEGAYVAPGSGVDGDYKVDAYVVHLGADFKF